MRKHESSPGPFFAHQLKSGDHYELSDGHPIECLPTGGRGSVAEGAGYQTLATDPDVEDIGIDTGYTTEAQTLRAPDLSIGKIPDEPGWVQGAPRLAVEYADTGQDEADLEIKIHELLEAGTEAVWVVRLVGMKRVEVHRKGRKMKTFQPGDKLDAPGILKYPVPVVALYDRSISSQVALRNLLQEHGYGSLDDIRREGREEGRQEGQQLGEIQALRSNLLAVLESRELPVLDSTREQIRTCDDAERLRRWNVAAITASSAEEILAG